VQINGREVVQCSSEVEMTLKPYLLRLHRWTTLVLAIPLIVVIVTGLILSFEPLAQQSKLDEPLSKERLTSLITKHDPEGKGTGLILRSYENALTITGAGPDGEVEIDLTSGEAVAEDGGFAWSEFFRTSRRMHETLLLDLDWLVTVSTWGMLVLAALGLLMGLPRLRNSLGGWHTASAWFTLPLVILSPLTGLAIVYGITFTTPPSGPRVAPMPLVQAVSVAAASGANFNEMVWLRSRGGRQLIRLYGDDGTMVSQITPDGLKKLEKNWPRAIHEGNWSRTLGPLFNILVSIVFIGLWITGLWIWARRTFFRKRQRDRATTATPAAQAAE
jgi:uncharacterized iron-regulated membrane protein